MNLQAAHVLLLRGGALLVFLAVGVTLPLCGGSGLWWDFAAWVVFGLAFWAGSCAANRGRAIASLFVQTASVLVLVIPDPCFISGNLLVVIGWQAALLLPMRGAVAWIVVQTLLPALLIDDSGDPKSLVWGYFIAVLGFQFLGLVTARIASGEAASRVTLAATLADLRVAQAQLADAARATERLRISRDLHDTIGHKVTAIAIVLDILARISDGPALDHARTARTLADELLGDARAIVHALRLEAEPNLGEGLARLAATIKGAELVLRVSPECASMTGEPACVMMRVVQEGVTNALRHAGAKIVSVTVDRTEAGVTVDVADDGAVASAPAPEHGLRGMEERLKGLGGRLRIDWSPGTGVRLHASLPA